MLFDFLVFYIPEGNSKTSDREKKSLSILIEKYGGILSEFHECFTY
jgi:hypothetical protein